MLSESSRLWVRRSMMAWAMRVMARLWAAAPIAEWNCASCCRPVRPPVAALAPSLGDPGLDLPDELLVDPRGLYRRQVHDRLLTRSRAARRDAGGRPTSRSPGSPRRGPGAADAR